MIGKDIKPHDKTLIEHELLEMKIKEENPTMEHWKAHEMAAKAYDYPKEADEYYGNLKNITKTKIIFQQIIIRKEDQKKGSCQ